jgi:hypothetical protein
MSATLKFHGDHGGFDGSSIKNSFASGVNR